MVQCSTDTQIEEDIIYACVSPDFVRTYVYLRLYYPEGVHKNAVVVSLHLRRGAVNFVTPLVSPCIDFYIGRLRSVGVTEVNSVRSAVNYLGTITFYKLSF